MAFVNSVTFSSADSIKAFIFARISSQLCVIISGVSSESELSRLTGYWRFLEEDCGMEREGFAEASARGGRCFASKASSEGLYACYTFSVISIYTPTPIKKERKQQATHTAAGISFWCGESPGTSRTT